VLPDKNSFLASLAFLTSSCNKAIFSERCCYSSLVNDDKALSVNTVPSTVPSLVFAAAERLSSA
jgi:hypothetical protein